MKTDERREERVAMQDLTKGTEDWGEKPEDPLALGGCGLTTGASS